MAEFGDTKSRINLRDIKYSYITKKIFSFLNEKQLLKMIIYRKELQKMLSIDIEDYKKISQICKIGEKNGNGKEFIINTNILIFEGEYSKGIRNGKGKEYYLSGKLKFEGVYLKGKRWNGKGYNINGNIEFEIKEGNGYIKEFNFYGKLEFEGDYLNGIRNGKGNEYYNGELKFEGEYLNGIRNGKGKEYNSFGNLIFEGEYLNGIRNGKGKTYNNYGELKFEGEYLNGIRNGKGKEYYNYGKLIFEGEYLYGIRNGKGKEYDNNGRLIFEGEYLNGKRNGKGKDYNYGMSIFEGEYLKGKRWNGKRKEYNNYVESEFEVEYLNGIIWKVNGYNINASNKFEIKHGQGYIKNLIDNNHSFKNTITKKYSHQIEKVFSYNIIKKEKYLLLNNEISFTILCNPKKNYQKELANIDEILKKESKFYQEKDFEDQKLIKGGLFSNIYSSVYIKDKQEVCLKKINIENMKKYYEQNELSENSCERDIKNEIELLKLFSDKANSVKYYGDYDKIVEKTIIMEKCECDLEDFLKKRGAFSTDEIKNIFRDINEIFKIMQQKKIIHRDLKLKNFLVKYLDKEKSKYIVKLSDYGIGKFLNKANKANTFSGYKGTDEYMAPEMALGKTKEYKNNYDIFSLGIILYQLAHNPLNNNLRHPFKIEKDQFLLITYCNLYDKDNYVIDFDESIKCEEYKDLVKLMLKLNPENRLNWDQYFAHPFFK